MRQRAMYLPELKPLRQHLRKNPTDAEKILWSILRSKQMGVGFRRKASIGDYIVDYYSAALNLVIHLDEQFYILDSVSYDKDSFDQFLKQKGITTMHLSSDEVLENYEAIGNGLRRYIEESFSKRYL